MATEGDETKFRIHIKQRVKLQFVILRCTVVSVRSFSFSFGSVFKYFARPGTKNRRMFTVTPPDGPTKMSLNMRTECAFQPEIITLSTKCDR